MPKPASATPKRSSHLLSGHPPTIQAPGRVSTGPAASASRRRGAGPRAASPNSLLQRCESAPRLSVAATFYPACRFLRRAKIAAHVCTSRCARAALNDAHLLLRSRSYAAHQAACGRPEGRNHEDHCHCDCRGSRHPCDRGAVSDRGAGSLADASSVQCPEDSGCEGGESHRRAPGRHGLHRRRRSPLRRTVRRPKATSTGPRVRATSSRLRST